MNLVRSLMMLTILACSSTPKGEYSRSHIDRPYSLPDDVASVQIGAFHQKNKAEEINKETSTSDNYEEEDDLTIPYVLFEQGISDSVSWVYPLGIKWTLIDDSKTTVGATYASLLFASYYSIDLWYRINKQLSIRPFFEGIQYKLLILNEERKAAGVKLVYQLQEHWALTTSYRRGNLEGNSDLIDGLAEAFGSNESATHFEADFSKFSVGSIYSFSSRWDFRGEAFYENLSYEDLTISAYNLHFSFAYFY